MLLGTMAAAVMAAMAAQFIMLSTEKWSPQRHVVFLKKLSNSCVSDGVNTQDCGFI